MAEIILNKIYGRQLLFNAYSKLLVALDDFPLTPWWFEDAMRTLSHELMDDRRTWEYQPLLPYDLTPLNLGYSFPLNTDQLRNVLSPFKK